MEAWPKKSKRREESYSVPDLAAFSPEGALETYRTFYPGKLENIEQAIVKDWPHDRC